MTLQYAAFLSYRHGGEDERLATRLHGALESYILPKRIGRTVGRARIGRVFRDVNELAAAPQLAPQIEEALAASGYLIVLCSPRAAESAWIAREVQWFLGQGRSDRILAVLAAGEPDVAFPPSLRQVAEPLAADLRADGTSLRARIRIATQRLVAAIVGCGFDDLVRRDRQRTLRRITALAGAASITSVVMAGLAVDAIVQRDAAESASKAEAKAREDAEGLAHFMLGDLNDSLSRIMRTELLLPVAERMLAYYLRMPADQASKSRNQIRALHDSANVFQQCGMINRAEDGYRATIAAAELRLQGSAVDRKIVADLVLARRNLAYLLLRFRRDLEGARKLFEASFHTALGAAIANPEDTGAQIELANCHLGMAELHEATGSTAEELTHCDQAIAVLERTERAKWDDYTRMSWAVIKAARGQALRRTGDLNLAESELRAAKLELEGLCEEHDEELLWQRELASVQGSLINILVDRGEEAHSLVEYGKQRQLLQRWLRVDPMNADFRRDLIVNLRNSSQVLRSNGNTEGALADLSEAERHARYLIEQEPDTSAWQELCVGVACELSSVWRLEGRALEADAALEAVSALVDAVPTSASSELGWSSTIANYWFERGQVAAARASHAAAETCFERARRLLVSLTEASSSPAEASARLVMVCNTMCMSLQREGKFDAARDLMSGLAPHLDRLLAGDPLPDWIGLAAQARRVTGDLALAAGDERTARLSHDESVTLERRRVGLADTPDHRFRLASALFQSSTLSGVQPKQVVAANREGVVLLSRQVVESPQITAWRSTLASCLIGQGLGYRNGAVALWHGGDVEGSLLLGSEAVRLTHRARRVNPDMDSPECEEREAFLGRLVDLASTKTLDREAELALAGAEVLVGRLAVAFERFRRLLPMKVSIAEWLNAAMTASSAERIDALGSIVSSGLSSDVLLAAAISAGHNPENHAQGLTWLRSALDYLSIELQVLRVGAETSDAEFADLEACKDKLRSMAEHECLRALGADVVASLIQDVLSPK